jgi:hypothetical protein
MLILLCRCTKSKTYCLDEVFNFFGDDLCLPDELNNDDVSEINIGIVPPIEQATAISDADSDESDGEVKAVVHHLPTRVLRSEAEHHQIQEESDSESVEMEHKKIKKIKASSLDWKKCTADQVVELNEDIFEANGLDLESPVHAFNEFFDINMVNMIVEESNLYSHQRGFGTTIDSDEFLEYLGILILSGYHRLPRRHMYWTKQVDCNVELVSDNMRRDTFDKVHRSLHFNNNMEIDDDRLYKVRPLFELVNKNCKKVSVSSRLSVDEQMLKYYGRHSAKQFIRGKPIRYGFKNWCVCAPNGYMYHAEPYCGASTRLPETGLGLGGNVVLGLLDCIDVPPKTSVYFDNLFTSISLISELSNREIGGTGTVRRNQVFNVPLTDPKSFKKTPRGI